MEITTSHCQTDFVAHCQFDKSVEFSATLIDNGEFYVSCTTHGTRATAYLTRQEALTLALGILNAAGIK